MTTQPALIPLPAVTERHMLDLLGRRYTKLVGNGDRWIRAEHVRSHAGFDARRTADFIAMDLWPSKGLTLHGHEVKVSRGDWLTELADPSKADEFRRYMDRWWLVVPDATIVRDDLPDGWGLMVARGPALAIRVPAPKLTPEPMPRTMQACLLRAAVKTAERPQRALAAKAADEATRAAYLHAARRITWVLQRSDDLPAAMAEVEASLREASKAPP